MIKLEQILQLKVSCSNFALFEIRQFTPIQEKVFSWHTIGVSKISVHPYRNHIMSMKMILLVDSFFIKGNNPTSSFF